MEVGSVEVFVGDSSLINVQDILLPASEENNLSSFVNIDNVCVYVLHV
jgi:hypothetical protein